MLRNFPLFLPLPPTLGILLPAPSFLASRTPPGPFSPGFPPPITPLLPAEMSGGKGRCKGNLETFSALLATFVAVKNSSGSQMEREKLGGGGSLEPHIFYRGLSPE